jgi:hypothetical protein
MRACRIYGRRIVTLGGCVVMLRSALCLLVLLFFHSAALGEKRIALVIGNGTYANVAKLQNPLNDSSAMAELLHQAGFKVIEKADLGVDAMKRTLREFSYDVRDADIAVVFYAGHGMEMNGVNYLIPVDATIASDVDVEDETITLDRVIRTIQPARHLQLVILDACRDNPFVRSMTRTTMSRSVSSGHGEVASPPMNTLIAYAQKAGLTAEDGEGAHSPFTTALLKHLATPGLDVEFALRTVRDEVLRATNNRQEPFKYGSMSGNPLPLVPSVPETSSVDRSPPDVSSDDQTICIERRGELLRDRDVKFWILHVRNRLGDQGVGEPLWENRLPLEEEKGTPRMCASIKYPKRGGFQFKVYVKFDSINPEPRTVDQVEKRLKEKVRMIEKDYPCMSGRPLTPKGGRPKPTDCVTYDVFSATIWILLTDFPYVRDREFWNNWWSSPLTTP